MLADDYDKSVRKTRLIVGIIMAAILIPAAAYFYLQLTKPEVSAPAVQPATVASAPAPVDTSTPKPPPPDGKNPAIKLPH